MDINNLKLGDTLVFAVKERYTSGMTIGEGKIRSINDNGTVSFRKFTVKCENLFNTIEEAELYHYGAIRTNKERNRFRGYI